MWNLKFKIGSMEILWTCGIIKSKYIYGMRARSINRCFARLLMINQLCDLLFEMCKVLRIDQSRSEIHQRSTFLVVTRNGCTTRFVPYHFLHRHDWLKRILQYEVGSFRYNTAWTVVVLSEYTYTGGDSAVLRAVQKSFSFAAKTTERERSFCRYFLVIMIISWLFHEVK